MLFCQDVLSGTSRLHKRPQGLPRIWGGSEAKLQKVFWCWGPSQVQTYQEKWEPIEADKEWEGPKELWIHTIFWQGDRGPWWGWHGQVEHHIALISHVPNPLITNLRNQSVRVVLNQWVVCVQWWAHRMPCQSPCHWHCPSIIHIYSYVEALYSMSVVTSPKYLYLFVCWSA